MKHSSDDASSKFATPMPCKGERYSYVLVTPARNEGAFIEQTIKSVIAQTIRPVRWVIVSDGSTDDTETIVERYANLYPWMVLIRRPQRADRHFAGKVTAFNEGYATLEGRYFDVIGNLDADITFDSDYFEFLMGKFAENSALGVAGTPFREGRVQYDYRYSNIEHVSGACQMFRRECFKAIGGYKPIKGGGIDWVAVTTARMLGWTTRTFPDRFCTHNRPIGTAQGRKLGTRFRLGQKDYSLGNHPLWELFRAGYQMGTKPFVFGGLLLLTGYCWAFARRAERPIQPELVAFARKEQLRRLKAQLARVFR